MLEGIKEKLCGRLVPTRSWVNKIDPRLQSTLFSILRGTDKDNGACIESKKITKMFRYIIQKDLGKKFNYMSSDVVRVNVVVNFLIKEYLNNKHWVEHVISAAYIISKHHPDSYVKEYWGSINRVCYGKIKKIKKEEKLRLEEEARINRIISKYIDIYTKREI